MSAQGVCVSGLGGSAQEGVCPGGVCLGGVYPGGVCPEKCLPGGGVSQYAMGQTSPL